MEKLKSQNLVDLVGAVPITLEMAPNQGLQPFSINIRSGEAALRPGAFPERIRRVHLDTRPGSACACVFPETDVRGGRLKGMVHLRHALRHAHVVCILSLKLEFEEISMRSTRKESALARQPAVSWNLQEFFLAISNQAQRIVVPS